MAIQTAAFDELDGGDNQQEDYDEDFDGNRRLQFNLHQQQHHQLQQLLAAAGDLRRRSISLNDILGSSFVHESANGERIIISRGWPATAHRRRSRRKSRSLSARRRVSLTVRRPSASNVGLHAISGGKQNHLAAGAATAASGGSSSGKLNDEQKHRLLVEYLRTVPSAERYDGGGEQFVLSSELDVESALKIHRNSISGGGGSRRRRSVTILKTSARHNDPNRQAQHRPASRQQVSKGTDGYYLNEGIGAGKALKKPAQVVHYDLPVHSDGSPIALSAPQVGVS